LQRDANGVLLAHALKTTRSMARINDAGRALAVGPQCRMLVS
jgi:hypothetical protein